MLTYFFKTLGYFIIYVKLGLCRFLICATSWILELQLRIFPGSFPLEFSYTLYSQTTSPNLFSLKTPVLWRIAFLLGLPKGSPSLKMPFVIFVVVFCVQSQIAVWALNRMRMIREHWFLPPLEGIFCQIIVVIQATEFLRNFRVLLGVQQPKNYRFDCEFVLIHYSNYRLCEMFEKRAPHGSINWLRNELVVPSNRLRVSRLAFRIICVSFLGVNKDFSG